MKRAISIVVTLAMVLSWSTAAFATDAELDPHEGIVETIEILEESEDVFEESDSGVTGGVSDDAAEDADTNSAEVFSTMQLGGFEEPTDETLLFLNTGSVVDAGGWYIGITSSEMGGGAVYRSADLNNWYYVTDCGYSYYDSQAIAIGDGSVAIYDDYTETVLQIDEYGTVETFYPGHTYFSWEVPTCLNGRYYLYASSNGGSIRAFDSFAQTFTEAGETVYGFNYSLSPTETRTLTICNEALLLPVRDSNGGMVILSSQDGNTWTVSNVVTETYSNEQNLAYADGYYYIFPESAGNYEMYKYYYSADSITWYGTSLPSICFSVAAFSGTVERAYLMVGLKNNEPNEVFFPQDIFAVDGGNAQKIYGFFTECIATFITGHELYVGVTDMIGATYFSKCSDLEEIGFPEFDLGELLSLENGIASDLILGARDGLVYDAGGWYLAMEGVMGAWTFRYSEDLVNWFSYSELDSVFLSDLSDVRILGDGSVILFERNIYTWQSGSCAAWRMWGDGVVENLGQVPLNDGRIIYANEMYYFTVVENIYDSITGIPSKTARVFESTSLQAALAGNGTEVFAPPLSMEIWYSGAYVFNDVPCFVLSGDTGIRILFRDESGSWFMGGHDGLTDLYGMRLFYANGLYYLAPQSGERHAVLYYYSSDLMTWQTGDCPSMTTLWAFSTTDDGLYLIQAELDGYVASAKRLVRINGADCEVAGHFPDDLFMQYFMSSDYLCLSDIEGVNTFYALPDMRPESNNPDPDTEPDPGIDPNPDPWVDPGFIANLPLYSAQYITDVGGWYFAEIPLETGGKEFYRSDDLREWELVLRYDTPIANVYYSIVGDGSVTINGNYGFDWETIQYANYLLFPDGSLIQRGEGQYFEAVVCFNEQYFSNYSYDGWLRVADSFEESQRGEWSASYELPFPFSVRFTPCGDGVIAQGWDNVTGTYIVAYTEDIGVWEPKEFSVEGVSSNTHVMLYRAGEHFYAEMRDYSSNELPFFYSTDFEAWEQIEGDFGSSNSSPDEARMYSPLIRSYGDVFYMFEFNFLMSGYPAWHQLLRLLKIEGGDIEEVYVFPEDTFGVPVFGPTPYLGIRLEDGTTKFYKCDDLANGSTEPPVAEPEPGAGAFVWPDGTTGDIIADAVLDVGTWYLAIGESKNGVRGLYRSEKLDKWTLIQETDLSGFQATLVAVGDDSALLLYPGGGGLCITENYDVQYYPQINQNNAPIRFKNRYVVADGGTVYSSATFVGALGSDRTSVHQYPYMPDDQVGLISCGDVIIFFVIRGNNCTVFTSLDLEQWGISTETIISAPPNSSSLKVQAASVGGLSYLIFSYMPVWGSEWIVDYFYTSDWDNWSPGAHRLFETDALSILVSEKDDKLYFLDQTLSGDGTMPALRRVMEVDGGISRELVKFPPPTGSVEYGIPVSGRDAYIGVPVANSAGRMDYYAVSDIQSSQHLRVDDGSELRLPADSIKGQFPVLQDDIYDIGGWYLTATMEKIDDYNYIPVLSYSLDLIRWSSIPLFEPGYEISAIGDGTALIHMGSYPGCPVGEPRLRVFPDGHCEEVTAYGSAMVLCEGGVYLSAITTPSDNGESMLTVFSSDTFDSAIAGTGTEVYRHEIPSGTTGMIKRVNGQLFVSYISNLPGFITNYQKQAWAGAYSEDLEVWTDSTHTIPAESQNLFYIDGYYYYVLPMTSGWLAVEYSTDLVSWTKVEYEIPYQDWFFEVVEVDGMICILGRQVGSMGREYSWVGIIHDQKVETVGFMPPVSATTALVHSGDPHVAVNSEGRTVFYRLSDIILQTEAPSREDGYPDQVVSSEKFNGSVAIYEVGKWYIAVDDRMCSNGRSALLYRSSDLADWEVIGELPVHGSNSVWIGTLLGDGTLLLESDYASARVSENGIEGVYPAFPSTTIRYHDGKYVYMNHDGSYAKFYASGTFEAAWYGNGTMLAQYSTGYADSVDWDVCDDRIFLQYRYYDPHSGSYSRVILSSGDFVSWQRIELPSSYNDDPVSISHAGDYDYFIIDTWDNTVAYYYTDDFFHVKYADYSCPDENIYGIETSLFGDGGTLYMSARYWDAGSSMLAPAFLLKITGGTVERTQTFPNRVVATPVFGSVPYIGISTSAEEVTYYKYSALGRGTVQLPADLLDIPVDSWKLGAPDTNAVIATIYPDKENPGYYRMEILGAGDIQDISTWDNTLPRFNYYRTRITKVTVGDGITSIGSNMFDGYSALRTAMLPNGLQSIGASAFSGCAMLGGMLLPTGLKTIGESAFHNTAIQELIIPASVTNIGISAFSGCNTLTSITFEHAETDPLSLGANAFAYYGSGMLATSLNGDNTAVNNFNWSGNKRSIPVTSVALDNSSVELEFPSTLQLTVTMLPVSATDKAVTWSSSKSEVASVSSSGLVTTVGEGSSVITATAVNGGALASCMITVVNTEYVITSVTPRNANFEDDCFYVEYGTTVAEVIGQLEWECPFVDVMLDGIEPFTMLADWSPAPGIDYDPQLIGVPQLFLGIPNLDDEPNFTNPDGLVAEVWVIVDDAPSSNIVSAVSPVGIMVPKGLAWSNLGLPTEVTVWTDEGEAEAVSVEWQNTYDPVATGEQTIIGNLIDLRDGLKNDEGYQAEIKITVLTVKSGYPQGVGSPTSSAIQAYLCDDPVHTGMYILYLQGVGATKDFTGGNSPWNADKSNIYSIVVGEGITALGKWIMYQVSARTVSLPSTLTTIREGAFWNCGALGAITFPASVALIEKRAFENCSNLKTITFLHGEDDPIELPTAGYQKGAFSQSGTVSTVVISENTTVNAYDWLADRRPAYVFAESIELSRSELTIRVGNTLSLSATKLPSSASATNSAIQWTSSDTSVATVSSSGFVTPVGAGECVITAAIAFDGVSASCAVTVLPAVTVTPPEGLTVQKTYSNSTLSGDPASYIVGYLCDDPVHTGMYILYLQGVGATKDFTGGNSPWNADKSNIYSIVVGEGITALGKWIMYQVSARTVSLPSTLTTIREGAFWNCGALGAITFPASVALIEKRAFENCSNLKTITFLHGEDDPIELPTAGYQKGAFSQSGTVSTVVISENTTVNAYDWLADRRIVE